MVKGTIFLKTKRKRLRNKPESQTPGGDPQSIHVEFQLCNHTCVTIFSVSAWVRTNPFDIIVHHILRFNKAITTKREMSQ